MFGRSSAFVRGIVATAVVVAIAASAGAAGSEAFGRTQGADHRAIVRVHASAPPWLKALMARSDALDRRYGLGKYAIAS